MTERLACVLFEVAPALEAIDRALSPLGGRRSQGAVLLGEATVEVVAAPWPGAQGQADSLARALLHRSRWEGAPAAVGRHRAFVRLAAPAGSQVEAGAALWRLTDLARALLAMPSALASFFPAGEALRSPAFVEESAAHHRQHGLPAFDIWTNLRRLEPDAAPGWTSFDLVGLAQLGLEDLEICFEGPFEAPDRFLFNTAHYLLQKGPVIRTGHTIDGPGGRWRATQQETSLALPARRTLRFFREGARPPLALLGPAPAGAEVLQPRATRKKSSPS